MIESLPLGAQWIIVGDALVDVSKFIMTHPGGEKVVRNFIGLDATENGTQKIGIVVVSDQTLSMAL
jgi:hypothetical protein